MTSFVKQIFLSVAKKLGLQLTEKTDFSDNYKDTSDISITAAIANRLATITTMDSTASVYGDNMRSKFLDAFIQEFSDIRMSVAAEVSLGTGDCILKPNTDGKRIAVDIISNENFTIVESIGSFIYGALIKCDEWKPDNGNLYERIEYHKLRDVSVDGKTVSVAFIYQMCFKNGKECDISLVPQWSNIKTEEYIANVDRLLFGRYKCPTVNRNDVNSSVGVPVTFGMDNVLEQAKRSYYRFNEEYEAKEPMIFIDKTLLKRDKDGTVRPPSGKERIVQQVRTPVDKTLIHEYSPEIRSESLDKGIEVNFRMLELLTGMSAGVLTKPDTNYATATEMKAALQMTYAFVTKFRKVLESGTDDLIYAVNAIANRNNVTPIGDYETKYDWSDSYVENLNDRFNQLIQAESIGAVDTAEVRAWTMNEDDETSKDRVAEIKASNPIVNVLEP